MRLSIILEKIVSVLAKLLETGTVYETEWTSKSIPKGTYTDVVSLTLTPGVYVIECHADWSAHYDSVYNMSLFSSGIYAGTVRNNMYSGGGSSYTRMVVLSEETVFTLQLYQVAASSVTGRGSISAVKIIGGGDYLTGYLAALKEGVLHEAGRHLKKNIKRIKDPARQKKFISLQSIHRCKSVWKNSYSNYFIRITERYIFGARKCWNKYKLFEYYCGGNIPSVKLQLCCSRKWTSNNDVWRWLSCVGFSRGFGRWWHGKLNNIWICQLKLHLRWETTRDKAGSITPKGGVCYE